MKNKMMGLTLVIAVLLMCSQAIAAPAAPSCPVTPADAGGLSNPVTVDASLGTCNCSKCRSNQYCCPTANGNCGCFPMPCP